MAFVRKGLYVVIGPSVVFVLLGGHVKFNVVLRVNLGTKLSYQAGLSIVKTLFAQISTVVPRGPAGGEVGPAGSVP